MATEVTGRPAAAWLDRAMLLGLLVAAGATQFSIALGQTALWLTLAAWAASLVVKRERPEAPPWFWPLLAYAGISLIATVFSIDRPQSLRAAKQMLLFLVVPATCSIAAGRRAHSVWQVIITVGAISAIIGVIEYGILNYDSLGQRPRGTLGHYMTYSGLLMLVICSVAARLLYERKDWIWPALVMPALLVALALTFTRSAWVGACAGVGLLLLLRDRRLLGILPVAAALFIAIAPAAVTDRAYSMFNLKDPTNRDRLAMIQAGTAIVKRYPLTGVGPNVVHEVYPNYRQSTAVDQTPPHLHNVPLQIAAERGLPALAIWVWFVISAAAGLWARFRSDHPRYLAAAGLGALAAMLAAGLFEYNFGDSEFLVTLLILLTLPCGRHPDYRLITSTFDRLRRSIDNFSSASVLIVGDVMLDQFVIGNVSRISPEAPVPVVEYEHDDYRVGGAANVAHNVRALGGRVELVGLTGADSAGQRLRHLLGECGIGTSGLVVDPTRRTTTKLRIVTTRNLQVARIDYESDHEASGEAEQALADQVGRLAERADAILVSDYLKGSVTQALMTRVVAAGRERGVPVLVDPKIPHVHYYRGATLVTPNHHEAEVATHRRIRSADDAVGAAGAFREVAGCLDVLITRGEHGMCLLHGQDAVHYAATAREVADVTGAGDTVIATAALALGARASMKDACGLANQAAGVVVAKFGPATLSQGELLTALERAEL